MPEHTGAIFLFPGQGLIPRYSVIGSLPKGTYAVTLEHRLGHRQKITGNIRFRVREPLQ
jgi:hypothetical protein